MSNHFDTTNYANQIVSNLERQGFTKDMIIGYLEGTINGLKYLSSQEISEYLRRTVNDTDKPY
jgi:hypothetical protein